MITSKEIQRIKNLIFPDTPWIYQESTTTTLEIEDSKID